MHKWMTRHLVTDFGRSTLAITGLRGRGDSLPGTAFLYNHLVEPGPEYDTVITFLVTAGSLAQAEMAEMWLRPDSIEPAGGASDSLLIAQFAQEWTRGGSGSEEFAVTPFASYDAHARTKGWSWDTQQVSVGRCANPADWKALDRSWAYVLYHPAQDKSRPVAVAVNGLRRDGKHWMLAKELPRGALGAPVFSLRPAGGQAVRLVAVGLVGGDPETSPELIPMTSVQALTMQIAQADG